MGNPGWPGVVLVADRVTKNDFSVMDIEWEEEEEEESIRSAAVGTCAAAGIRFSLFYLVVRSVSPSARFCLPTIVASV